MLDRGRSFAAATESDDRKRQGDRIWFDFGGLPTQRAQIFAFARAALQNGLQREASALFELIERRLPVEINDQDLLHELQRSIGEAVLARMEVDALDLSHSREEMLRAYSTFATRFPASDKVPYTRAAVAVLQRMIEEDRTHPARSIAALAPAEQAAEWIHRLRDTKIMTAYWVRYARYPMYPGTLPEESGKTPVHHLVDLGDAAVPALLDALADDSFTRTQRLATFGGDRSPRPMRVSDFALGVLDFMAGRTFGGTPAGNAAARPAAEAWWVEVQGKGARQQLMDDTAAGGDAGMVAAPMLVQRYPESAISPIRQALSSAPSKGVRAQFVAIAATIPGDSVLPLLRAQLVPQAGSLAQNVAARALLVRGHRDVVPVMIQAWRNLQPRLRDPVPPPGPLQPNGAGGFEQDDPLFDAGDLIAFLAGCGEPRAIEALAAEGPKAAVDVRLGIVLALLPPGRGMTFGASDRMGSSSRPRLELPAAAMGDIPRQAVDAAIERLLRAALQDDSALRPQSWSQFDGKAWIQYDDKVVNNPRIRDIAALVLAARWPDRYAFDLFADASARNAAITVMRDLDQN